MVLFLQTTHLDLVAATLLHLDAELAGVRPLGKLLGVAVPKDWPPAGLDRRFVGQFRERVAAGGHEAVGWYGWYAICRRTALQPATLVGIGGFFGPPDAGGAVELGFSILPAYRGRGHATEMVQALVAHALSQPRVERIVADVRATDRPTLAVLLRSGFTRLVRPATEGLIRCECSRDAMRPADADDEAEAEPDEEPAAERDDDE